jgi:hypothetical protein
MIESLHGSTAEVFMRKPPSVHFWGHPRPSRRETERAPISCWAFRRFGWVAPYAASIKSFKMAFVTREDGDSGDMGFLHHGAA